VSQPIFPYKAPHAFRSPLYSLAQIPKEPSTMGKRKTAKTGDKALYNARDKLSKEAKASVDHDNMYNEVDRYNNAKDELQDDMLTFDQKDDSDEEGMQNDVQGVFDLGLDNSDDESDSDDSDDSEDDASHENESSPRRPLEAPADDEDDDDSIDDFNDAESDVLNWGKRKRDYYHGDTADLEIMEKTDAVEDAELEEEGAKEILKARMEGMTEDDFMLDDDDDSEDEEVKEKESSNIVEMMTGEMQSTKRRKLSKLSKKDKLKLMGKTHPELLPLVSHFRDTTIRPCSEKTSVVVNALKNEENAEVSHFVIVLTVCIHDRPY